MKKEEHTKLSYNLSNWNSLRKVVYEVVLSHLKGSTVAVLFTVFIAKVQRHHKYRPRKFLNLNITILMAPLIPSVVIPPGICRASCRCQRRELCQKTSSRRGVGLLSILLEAVNVVPFFQYFTVTSKLVEKKLTFFSDPPVGVLYEPPGPTVGLLKPFQKKMTNARQMPGGMGTLRIDWAIKGATVRYADGLITISGMILSTFVSSFFLYASVYVSKFITVATTVD